MWPCLGNLLHRLIRLQAVHQEAVREYSVALSWQSSASLHPPAGSTSGSSEGVLYSVAIFCIALSACRRHIKKQ